jgi:hypothetical protein
MRLVIIIILVILIGCSNDTTIEKLSKGFEEKVSLEQYFYSESEENLKKLREKLVSDGYTVSKEEYYELDGKKEWSFYSTKEISKNQVASEDLKSEKYANQFEVNYDGHGFSLVE